MFEANPSSPDQTRSPDMRASPTKVPGNDGWREAKYRECIQLCRELLSIEEDVESPKAEDVLEELGERTEKEQRRIHRRLKGRSQTGEATEVHVYLANCYMTLGNVYKDKSRFDKAEYYYSKAKESYKAAFWRLPEEEDRSKSETEDEDSEEENIPYESTQTEDDDFDENITTSMLGFHNLHEKFKPQQITDEEQGWMNTVRLKMSPSQELQLEFKKKTQLEKARKLKKVHQLTRDMPVVIDDIFPLGYASSPSASPSTITSNPMSPSTSDTRSNERSNDMGMGFGSTWARWKTKASNMTIFGMFQAENEPIHIDFVDKIEPAADNTRSSTSDYKLKSQTFQRESIISEIISTEREYVESLQNIMTLFIGPIRSQKLLPEKEISLIFSNLETLVELNLQVLLNLEERVKSQMTSDTQTVGDIFQQMGDFFKMYSVYCSNQSYTNERIAQYSNTFPAFKTLLDEVMQDPRSKQQSLSSFLIKPVQRICKYPILFRELVRNTPKSHPDHERLLEAKKKIEDIVIRVNEGQNFKLKFSS
eukprot:TRINITY_DN2823_c0_g1_i3.p1 TRINITY_DN2823_c0_g1~~TRINITY_DN2823_c0_g1_i3.p1  ORF type:complete len:580 (+),score=228.25 TRINITY_DN2823_c0_g1_i3:133-1740(+)